MKKKSNKSGLGVVIGTLAVIAGAFAAMFLCALISGLVLNASIKDEESFIILTIPSAAVFIVYFILFEVIFFKWQFYVSLKQKKMNAMTSISNEEEIISPEKFKKVSNIITIVVICLCLIFPLIYMRTYTKFADTTITEQALFSKEEYTIDDVNGYSLLCNSDGMKYTISMKNGKSYEIFNADSLISEKFNQKHESMFGYAAYLSKTYDAQERIIRKRVSGTDRMREAYEKDHPDVWKYLEIIINE